MYVVELRTNILSQRTLTRVVYKVGDANKSCCEIVRRYTVQKPSGGNSIVIYDVARGTLGGSKLPL